MNKFIQKIFNKELRSELVALRDVNFLLDFSNSKYTYYTGRRFNYFFWSQFYKDESIVFGFFTGKGDLSVVRFGTLSDESVEEYEKRKETEDKLSYFWTLLDKSVREKDVLISETKKLFNNGFWDGLVVESVLTSNDVKIREADVVFAIRTTFVILSTIAASAVSDDLYENCLTILKTCRPSDEIAKKIKDRYYDL